MSTWPVPPVHESAGATKRWVPQQQHLFEILLPARPEQMARAIPFGVEQKTAPGFRVSCTYVKIQPWYGCLSP